MPRWVAVAFVWLMLLGIGVAIWKLWLSPKQKAAADQAVAEQKEKIINNTADESFFKNKVSIGLDSFSGYAVLRSPRFIEECSSSSLKVNLVEDTADYNQRLKKLQTGELNMAVFTIDALIKASANLKDMPATIVAIIDETKGADAMVGASKLFPSIDALNNSEVKVVLTPDTPSETLTRVLMFHFGLNRLNKSAFVNVADAQAVYDAYKNSKPTDKQVYVLWEPFVSKILDNADYRVVVDSSKFKGYIVDVLVVNRDFLVKNEDTVQTVIKSYFRSNYFYKDKMESLIKADAAQTGMKLDDVQVKKLVQGIAWKNTQENYAHFGYDRSSPSQHIEDMVLNITSVLSKTGAINKDPSNGKPNLFYYSRIVKTLHDSNFHPGFDKEKIASDSKLAILTEEDWKRVVPVGTLQLQPVVFGRGTATITATGEAVLTDLVEKLKVWPQYYLMVTGHAFNQGDLEANKTLAGNRAKAVVDFLIKQGIDKDRIKSIIAEPSGSTTVGFVLGQLPY